MCASASTASAGLVGNSVHVSAKNLVDTSILKRSVAIKVPRLDAYPERAEAKAECASQRGKLVVKFDL